MKYWIGFILALGLGTAHAETGTDMLPAGERNTEIPAPAEVFGFETGEQHVRHDQLVSYFRELSAASDRVKLVSLGRTHERREQVMAIVSSPDNLARIDEIREKHLAVTRGEAEPGEAPVILWQGYSIHGDESSGSNAVSLYAWHLATSSDPEVVERLDDVVVLIDPSLNPDGMGRYAAWATSRRSETPVADEAHQEHDQPWPSGRGNHYWFDLNRDWLLLQHPASRNRVEVLNRWRPHVVTDHHEMGSSSTFFFQPGVPDRTHPLTPERNQALTGRIAEFHGEKLDEAGRLYYTEESFDDFYYGKGSTYPDITGGVGILFEQATTDGQLVDTPYGEKSFAFSVKGQLLTSLSTFEAAHGLRDELRNYQADFFAKAREQADGAWLVGNAGNPARMREFLKILDGHDIRFRPLAESVRRDGVTYRPGEAWVVPMDQQQSRLIGALFETRTEFPSHVFYDVSTWTLPLAFDLPYARLGSVPDVGEWTGVPAPDGRFDTNAKAVAYAFEWRDDRAPTLLQSLLSEDIKAMAATKPLTVNTPDGRVELPRGSIVVPTGIQSDRRGDIQLALARAAREHGTEVHAVLGGLTASGIDLGSPSLPVLEPVKPLLVVGGGTDSYEAGEFWHMADTRLGLPVTHVKRDRFERIDLADYTHVILVDTRGSDWGDEQAQRVREWVSNGGILVTQQDSARWVTDQGLLDSKSDKKDNGESNDSASSEEETEPERRNYADHDKDYAKTLISGTIFETDADVTHPLAYGLPDRSLPVFKDSAETLPVSDNAYATVARFTDKPLMSGYVSDEREKELAGTAAITADRVGSGLVIRMSVDPLFRGYWHGMQRLMVNSLYFGQLVESTDIPD